MTQRQERDRSETLLTTTEVASALRVSRRTVERYAASGRLASISLPSGIRRYRRSDLDSLLGGRPSTESHEASA